MSDEERLVWRCSLENVQLGRVSRRARGVYLGYTYDQRNGIEEYDAFSTLAKAKAWVKQGMKPPSYRNVRWVQESRHETVLYGDEWDEVYEWAT